MGKSLKERIRKEMVIDEVEELDKLASKFIIGHKKLTRNQSDLIKKKHEVEEMLKVNANHGKRMLLIIEEIDKKLLDSDNGKIRKKHE